MTYVCEAYTPEWHSERFSCLTGSRIATLLGKNPFDTREDLKESFRGRENSVELNRKMIWGMRMEEPNMRIFEEMYGSCIVHPTNSFYRRGNIGATLDGLVVLLPEPLKRDCNLLFTSATSYADKAFKAIEQFHGTENSVGLIEMKQTALNYYSRREGKYVTNLETWGKEPPEYYWVQVQAQLYVTGLPWGLLCGRLGAADMRIHTIFPDPNFWKEMEREVETFFDELEIENLASD